MSLAYYLLGRYLCRLSGRGYYMCVGSDLLYAARVVLSARYTRPNPPGLAARQRVSRLFVPSHPSPD